MNKLAGFQRKYLRGLAHELKPVVMIGKSGLTDAVHAMIDQALTDHELIKIKFVDFKDEKEVLSLDIATKSKSENVGGIGNIVIFYRQQEDIKKRKIKIPVKQQTGE